MSIIAVRQGDEPRTCPQRLFRFGFCLFWAHSVTMVLKLYNNQTQRFIFKQKLVLIWKDTESYQNIFGLSHIPLQSRDFYLRTFTNWFVSPCVYLKGFLTGAYQTGPVQSEAASSLCVCADTSPLFVRSVLTGWIPISVGWTADEDFSQFELVSSCWAKLGASSLLLSLCGPSHLPSSVSAYEQQQPDW